MKLKDFLENRDLVVKDMRRSMASMFKDVPAHSTLQKIVKEENMCGLEVAFMIVKWTEGKVSYEDLIVNAKRKFTYEVEERRTVAQRVADPRDEVHEISDEDLEAAADRFDELFDEFY